MANQVFLTVLLFLWILKFGNGYYYHGGTTERMKWKVVYLDRELIKAAVRDIQRIDFIKEYYLNSPVYEIGQMLYFIRSKFARMVRVFVLSLENDASFETYHLHLPAMQEIHRISLEIYHLIEMLEEHEMKSHVNIANVKILRSTPRQWITTPNPISKAGESLRQRPINIPSFSKKGFYARKPNEVDRRGIMVKRTRDVDPIFESDID